VAKKKGKSRLVSLTAEGQVLETELQKLPGFKRNEEGWTFFGSFPSVDGINVKTHKKSCIFCKYATKELTDATKTCIPCLSTGKSRFKANGKGGV